VIIHSFVYYIAVGFIKKGKKKKWKKLSFILKI